MLRLLVVSLAAAAALAAGCAKNQAGAPASDAAKTGGRAVRVLELSGNDAMKYDVTRLEVSSGELVRVVLRNVGVAPKASMAHNFVLLKAGANVEAFIAAAAPLAAQEYFPQAMADQVIAHTRLAGPKERAEVTFTAPVPGEYVYVCTFPGHFVAGMRGVLVVK